MLRYHNNWPPLSSRRGPPGTPLQISGDEIDGFIPGVPQPQHKFEFTPDAVLINPDFSILRIRTPGGADIGTLTILNGAIDGEGGDDPDRLAW